MILSVNHIEYDMELTKAKRKKNVDVPCICCNWKIGGMKDCAEKCGRKQYLVLQMYN